MAAAAVAVLAVAAVAVYLGHHGRNSASTAAVTSSSNSERSSGMTSDSADTGSTDPSSRLPDTSSPDSSSKAPKSPQSSTPGDADAVTSPEGMWWGVDSSGPITAAAIKNVHGWYRGGHTPQFWGRYLSGHYAVDKAELAYARSRGIYIYLLVNDANCSQCSGGRDVCGNDKTAGQARGDAKVALAAARKLAIPDHAVLFKDIEQVSGCRGEPTATYLDTWYLTLRDTHYRTGFYGNVHQQSFDFPRAYCAAVAKDETFGDDVALDMNEDEPQLGAPKKTVGPDNAPKFKPRRPDCAPKSAVQIWQYGESTSRDNYTDIDLARPDVKGLLAPDGTITGG